MNREPAAAGGTGSHVPGRAPLPTGYLRNFARPNITDFSLETCLG